VAGTPDALASLADRFAAAQEAGLNALAGVARGIPVPSQAARGPYAAPAPYAAHDGAPDPFGHLLPTPVPTSTLSVGDLTAATLDVGELDVREFTAGQLAARELAARELAARELTVSEVAAGELAVRDVTARELAVGEQARTDVTAGELALGELAVAAPVVAAPAAVTGIALTTAVPPTTVAPLTATAPPTTVAPPTATAPPTTASDGGQHATWRGRAVSRLHWPLVAGILAMQAALSLRLVPTNTAYVDEAIYLTAGHLEIAHWLHGAPVPAYPTYFSGAPVIYPPIAAVADSLGGLAAARVLSLLFMLGTTALLWCLTSRLFGRRAAACAATLFAVLGPTLQLGALATFDALALLLLAASAWCMVASRDRDDSAPLLLAGTLLLTLANATKYTTMLFDPSVIVLAGLAVASRRGTKAAVARSGYVAAGTIALISALLAIGGPWYLAGVRYTTVKRPTGTGSALAAISDAARWAGPVWVIAAAGVIVCLALRRPRAQVLILAVLTVTATLPPLAQARIHTVTSLSKHADIGAWFAAAAAGYALARLSRLARRRWLRLAVAGLVLAAIAVPGAIAGRSQARALFRQWPDSAQLIAQLRPLTRAYPGGHYLAEDYAVPAYYLQRSTSWQHWSGTSYFRYRPPGTSLPLTGLAAYDAAIARHYFSLVVLSFGATANLDAQLTADLRLAGGYREIAVLPPSAGGYRIWAYEPSQPAGGP
jgi:4-amino-4-deoxy-L-arabinose transferase-like glycosyltransferase